jgi:hypothetical protein
LNGAGGSWRYRRGGEGRTFQTGGREIQGHGRKIQADGKKIQIFLFRESGVFNGLRRIRAEILSFSAGIARRPVLAAECLSGTPTIARLLIFSKKMLSTKNAG